MTSANMVSASRPSVAPQIKVQPKPRYGGRACPRRGAPPLLCGRLGRVAGFQIDHLDGVIALCSAEGWPTYPSDPTRALAALQAPGSITVVSLAERREVVGFAHGLGDGVTAYLGQLLVAPGHRRQGRARQLILEFARLCGSPDRVDLLTDSAGAIDLCRGLPHRPYQGFRLHLGSSTSA